MNNNDLLRVLERIAISLEEIVDILKGNVSQVPQGERRISQERIKDELKEQIQERSILKKNGKIINNADVQIEKFFSSKRIIIKNRKNDEDKDEILDGIATFMGDRYQNIRKFLLTLKKHLNTGEGFKLNLKDARQEKIRDITFLAHKLFEIAFLEEYKYQKSSKILYAKPSKIPDAINFFTGNWLERFLKSSIIKTVNKLNLYYEYMQNIQIVLPNGNNFELDLVFAIEKDIFWFEAKTGDYQKYISRYSKIAKILNLDLSHAFMVLTDITDEGANALRSLFNMNVIRIDKFTETFEEILTNRFSGPT